jgi:polysaccharide biosynthesis protein PslH
VIQVNIEASPPKALLPALMRILYVTQIVPYPPHGGVLQRGFNLLRELGQRHEVHLLAFHHPDELPHGDPVEHSKRELGAFCRTVEYFDLVPKKSAAHMAAGLAMAAFHPAPFSVLAHRSGPLAERISQLCATAPGFDLVHLDTIALAPYAVHCGASPLVLAHHNIESQLMERRAEREKGFLQKLYVRQQARRIRRLEAQEAGRFATNITVSPADAELLGQICPGARTAVIPNGVDTDYFHPRPGNETPTLVFTGGMGMFANRDAVHWFIDSIWPLVKQRVPEAQFLAIGKKASQYALDSAARDSAIKVPGFVPDVRPYVERSAIYVVPIRVGGGTRLKVVDAMAQGKAIVSTSLGVEGIEARDGEHFVVADDAQAFADRIVHLLHHPEERARLGAAARERAQKTYCWKSLGRQLEQVYLEVAQAARG